LQALVSTEVGILFVQVPVIFLDGGDQIAAERKGVSRSWTHATYFRAVSRHYTPEGCKQKELELKHHRVSRNRRALRNVLMASSVAAVLAAGGSIWRTLTTG
jgi:hypothetical protein